MALPRALTSALETLSSAVEQLEASVRQTDGLHSAHAAGSELGELRSRNDDLVAAQSEDRARLAELLRVNAEVNARLGKIAAALRSLAAAERSSAPPNTD